VVLQAIELKDPGLNYPGFIFQFETVRDPTQTLLRYFVPTLVIDLMLLVVYELELDGPRDRIEQMEKFMLTLMYLFAQMRAR